MAFEILRLKQNITINGIVTIHYFDYMSDFSFPGEAHDFWELLCMDRGEIYVQADDKLHVLKRGDIIFHKPNEFHNVKANGQISPSLVVISFKCLSPAMMFFENKILSIDEKERNLLAEIIIEARSSYENNLDDPYFEKLVRSDFQDFGSEQLIKLYLEQILISLIRRNTRRRMLPEQSPLLLKKTSNTEIHNRIITYLEKNLQSRLTIEQICQDNLISRSQLQKLMQEKHDCGVIDYFSKMKIRTAKQLIRDNHLNFTQISDFLGYNSVHYFSRQFKKIAGMTPSEYSSSIKILSENPHFTTPANIQPKSGSKTDRSKHDL